MAALSDELKQAINNAFDDGCPIIWSSVDADGQSVLNFFGTSQAYSDDQIAIWMRNTNRGFLQRTAANPRVSMMYRNAGTRLSFQIHGEARRVDDEAVRTRVYDAAPARERESDPNKEGTAVVVDVVRVIQRNQVVWSRDGSTGAAD